MTDTGAAGGVLTVDLDAVAANWRLLAGRAAGAVTAAVVKADAYGLGIDRVAPALARAGCRTFFVAQLDEGLHLRGLLPEAEIYVLNGAPRGAEAVLAEHGLTPVLNALGDIEAWAAFARKAETRKAAALHVDTGMARLGLPPTELDADRARLDGIDLVLVMSHLACADDAENPMNERQRRDFAAARAGFPGVPASFAASSGIFLGTEFHFDLVRPGVALYGAAPLAGAPNPMAQVVRLQGKILQVREIDTPQTVGYGATHQAGGRERIATVGVGYADGYLRSLSNVGSGVIGGVRVPLVGRVSMDLTTFDVSHVAEADARPGAWIDLIGLEIPVDAVATDAGTIAYEILTSLGPRYARVYTGGD